MSMWLAACAMWIATFWVAVWVHDMKLSGCTSNQQGIHCPSDTK